MQWHKTSEYTLERQPYTISRQYNGEKWDYTLWGPGKWYGRNYQPLGYFDTADEAKDAASQHRGKK